MNTKSNKLGSWMSVMGLALNIRQFLLALLVLGGMAMTNVASAARIELDVIVPGYGWVVVRPDSNTGGAIRWDSARYVYYTDRVNRGEKVYAFCTPETGETTAPAKYGIYCQSKGRYIVPKTTVPWSGWCWYAEYVVSTDPWDDNLYFDIVTNLGSKMKRIPIGLRKP